MHFTARFREHEKRRPLAFALLDYDEIIGARFVHSSICHSRRNPSYQDVVCQCLHASKMIRPCTFVLQHCPARSYSIAVSSPLSAFLSLPISLAPSTASSPPPFFEDDATPLSPSVLTLIPPFVAVPLGFAPVPGNARFFRACHLALAEAGLARLNSAATMSQST